MDDSIGDALRAHLEKENRRKEAEELKQWCAQLDQTPADTKLVLPADYLADIELQPMRWFTAGMNLIESAHVLTRAGTFDRSLGAVLQSYLPYPVFQLGTETFLKGMWLCQHEDCRKMAAATYCNLARRRQVLAELLALGHNLLEITARLRALPKYQADPAALRFLGRIEAVIRQHYYPLYAADERSREWAYSRYPKRFYNDTAGAARADSYQSYPQQRLVLALFTGMPAHLDQLWGLHEHLRTSEKTNPGTKA